LWSGQESGAARIGNTGKPFDEPVHSGSVWTQNTPALRVALRRVPAVSPRSTVLPIRPSLSVRCRYRPWRITESSNRLEIATTFAALALLAILGVAIFASLSLLEWVLLRRWHESAIVARG